MWAPRKRPGRAPKKGRHDQPNAISVNELARKLCAKEWHTIKWREGSNEGCRRGLPVCMFASKQQTEQRMVAHRMAQRRGRAYQILAVYLPKNIRFRDLVDAAKLRWRIDGSARTARLPCLILTMYWGAVADPLGRKSW
jgi:hypothetical protein